MLADLFKGAGYFFAGLGMINTPGLRRYIVIPLLINIVLFTLLVVWLTGEFGALVALYAPQLPDWLAWLDSVVWLLFALIIAIAIFFSFAIVANLVAAPFNSLLAEAAEAQLTGVAPAEGGWLKGLREAPRALLDELRKLGYFLRFAIPLLLLFLIPVINLTAPLLWGLFSAWLLALEYLDYPLGNHNLRLKQQRELLSRRRPLAFGFGVIVLFATLIPFFNLLAIPAATLGATVLWVKELRQKPV